MRPGATPWIILIVFAVDRATKWWALRDLMPRATIALLPFFHLTYVENTGAAFGVFRGSNAGLIVVAVLLLGALLYARRRLPAKDRLAHWGLALVAGGALGNLYDRLAYGYVVDFLDFRIWPVFNIADSCISVGAACLALGMYRRSGAS